MKQKRTALFGNVILLILIGCELQLSTSYTIISQIKNAFSDVSSVLAQTQTVQAKTTGTESANGETLILNLTDRGAAHTARVRVDPPVSVYKPKIKGYVARSGLLSRILLYTVTSTLNLNTSTGFDDPNAGQSPMGRQLLDFTSSGSSPVQQAGFEFGCNLASGFDFIPIGGAIISSAIKTSTDGTGACNSNFVSKDEYYKGIAKIRAVADADRAAFDQLNKTEFAIKYAINDINVELADAQTWIQSANTTLIALSSQADNTEQGLSRFSNLTAIAFTQLSGEVKTNNDLIHQVSAELAALTAGERTTLSNIVTNFVAAQNNTNDATKRLAAEISRLKQVEARMVSVLSSNIQLAARVAINGITEEPIRQHLAIQQWAHILSVRAQGLTEFLSDPGREPVANIFNLPDEKLTRTMSINGVQRMYTRNGNIGVIALTTVVVRKWTVALVTEQLPINDLYSLLNALGGENCTTTSQGPTYCTMWIELQETICDIKGLSSPDPTALHTWVTSIAPVVDTTVCQSGSIGNGPFNGLIIKTPDQFWKFQEDLCAQGVYTSMGFYRQYSRTRLGFFDSPYNIAACTSSLQDLLFPDPDVLSSFTVVYMMGLLMTDSYGLRSQNITGVASELFGELANDISWGQDTPFRRLKAGQMGKVKKASFMSFPPLDCGADPLYCGLLPVYQLDFVDQISKVHVSIDGGPEEVVDGTVSNPFADKFLPREGDLFIGNPFSSWKGTTPLFNFKSSEIDWLPSPRANCQKPIYTLVPSPSHFHNANWTDFYQVPTGEFDAECARLTADQAEVFVDTATHICQTPIGSIQTGTVCDIASRFDVETDSTPGSEKIEWTSRGDDEITFTFTAPLGAIEGLVGSQCPNVNPLRLSANTYIYEITNPIAAPNRIRIDQCCGCKRSQEIVIDPFATDRFSVQQCETQIAGQPEYLKIFYDPGTGFFPCNGTISADILTAPGSTVFATSQVYVDQRDATMVDTSVSALSTSIRDLATINMQIVGLAFKTFTVNGFNVDISLPDYRALLDSINATLTSTIDNGAAIAQTAKLNLTEVAIDIANQADIDKANVAQALADEQAKLNVLIVDRSNTDRSVHEMNVQIDLLSDKIKIVDNKTDALDQYADGLGKGGSTSGLDFNGLGLAIGSFFSWLNPLAWGSLLAGFLGGIFGPIIGAIFSFFMWLFMMLPIIDWWFPCLGLGNTLGGCFGRCRGGRGGGSTTGGGSSVTIVNAQPAATSVPLPSATLATSGSFDDNCSTSSYSAKERSPLLVSIDEDND